MTGETKRLASLDVLRGMAVAGMILVVSPGDWSQTYAPLRHAAWNGATLADMVFPTFLFSVGVALGLSFPRPWQTPQDQRRFRARLLRRVVALIVLGLLVEATYVWAIALGGPYPGGGGLAHLRIPGILQRIGLCYGLAGMVVSLASHPAQDGRAQLSPRPIVAVILALLAGYWLLLALVPVPGFGAGQLTPDGSLPAFIDRTLFTEPHLWPLGSATGARPATYDPEGLLATLPATANVLFGVLVAMLWRHDPKAAVGRIAAAALLLMVAGLALDPVFVINKRIWTSSFALLSGGVSAMTLAALTIAMRVKIVETTLTPLRVLGGNAILAFLLSTVMSRIAGFALLPERGGLIAPQAWGNHHALALVADPKLASFLCALGVVGLVTLAIWSLHRRAIHIRL